MNIDEIKAHYNLPDFPESEDVWDTEARILVLFRFNQSAIVLSNPVPFEAAREYASRDDTHGEGWFVGFDQHNDYEPGDEY